MEKEDNGTTGTAQPEFDNQGYLIDYTTWTPALGESLASDCGVEMTEKHWQLVEYARQHYSETHKAPTRRKMVADIGVDSQELFDLFPASPMRKLCRVAGLPKPKNCL